MLFLSQFWLFSISSVYAENVNTTYSDGLSQTNHLDITNQIDEEGTNGLSEIGIQSRENSDIDDLEPSTTWVSENKEDTSINKLPEKKLIAKDTTLNAEIETNKVSLNNEYLTYNINETIKNNTIINKTKEDIKKVQEQVIRITTQVNTIYRRIIIINQKIETQQKNTNKQQTTKIIANKKTYKSKVKTKKYSITLKSGKKRLKRFKVYLTIKGKKYKKTFY